MENKTAENNSPGDTAPLIESGAGKPADFIITLVCTNDVTLQNDDLLVKVNKLIKHMDQNAELATEVKVNCKKDVHVYFANEASSKSSLKAFSHNPKIAFGNPIKSAYVGSGQPPISGSSSSSSSNSSSNNSASSKDQSSTAQVVCIFITMYLLFSLHFIRLLKVGILNQRTCVVVNHIFLAAAAAAAGVAAAAMMN